MRDLQLRGIDTNGYMKLKPPETLGRPPKLEWLAIRSLVIDPSYQREINREGRTNIRRIVEQFNWSMFSPVIVASAGGNRYAIVDGQHRTTAAALLGLDKVPCQVIEAIPGEQAVAFRAINGNTIKLSSMNLHHAAVAAGDEKALLIQKVCAGADCVILRYPKPWNVISVGETMAVKAVGSAIRKFGPDTVTTALRCVRDSGDGNPGLLRSHIIVGISEVLFDHPEWRDLGGALIDAFDSIDVGSAFEDAAAISARTRGTSILDQFESKIVEALSKELSKLAARAS